MLPAAARRESTRVEVARSQMSSNPDASAYDEDYYANSCGAQYVRDERTLRFYAAIADRIVAQIQPRTALDAGCAKGFLVEALRDRGVECYGVDTSEYAISQVAGSAVGWCRVGSVTEPFGVRYDLIICIEVLEHLAPEEARAAVANLCASTDDILFSSSCDDFGEVTHINVEPPEYWAEAFAEHGFYRDVDFDASFITPWAARFRRRADPPARVVRDYERRLWQLSAENRALRQAAANLRADLAATRRELAAWRDVGLWRDELLRSPGWRILRLLQLMRRRVAPPGSRRDQFLRRLFRQPGSQS